MWSTPPLRSRLGSLGHTSTVSTPGLDDLCSEWLAASLNAASAAASASSAGAGRFLRSFESAFHLSVIAAIASSVMPVGGAGGGASLVSIASAPAPPAAVAPAARAAVCAATDDWCDESIARAWRRREGGLSFVRDDRRDESVIARASSRSRMSRAITRHAASCWYSACASSLRVSSRCALSVCVSSMSESHSFWNVASRPGSDVAFGGRGLTPRLHCTGIRSSVVSGCPVMGHVPPDASKCCGARESAGVSASAVRKGRERARHARGLRRAFSIRCCSNRWPESLLTTGLLGTSPLIAQKSAMAAGGARGRADLAKTTEARGPEFKGAQRRERRSRICGAHGGY